MKTPFDPYAIYNHYSLEIACYWLHQKQPQSIRLCTDNADIVIAIARRLMWTKQLIVETENIVTALQNHLNLKTTLYQPNMVVEAAFVPFSRQMYPIQPIAQWLVVVGENSFSYKSLLYPGQVGDNVFALKSWFEKRYRITDKVSLLEPYSMLRWSIASLAGSRFPSIHFQMGQRALDNIYVRNYLWWSGYIIVMIGEQIYEQAKNR
ncbi:MAG: hypothetical protein B6242_08830 [Anaerolineaceae bacterium 4572_78]|nr:MAG: hypothetical protein B6242_08830 [Anaerolineaceae bacterium 4572_78]